MLLKFMLEFISGERGRCGVLWTSGTMNSGHVTERGCVHVCWSGSSKCDFVALVASRNTTLTKLNSSLLHMLSLFSLFMTELYARSLIESREALVK